MYVKFSLCLLSNDFHDVHTGYLHREVLGVAIQDLTTEFTISL